MERFFQVKEHGSTVKTEIMAGITTFMAMAYILMVNAGMFADPFGDGTNVLGVSYGAVYVATAISAVVGTLLIGFLSNLPLAQASGMGLNAYFVYTVCVGMGLSYTNALVLVLFDGVIFVLLTVTGLRKLIFDAIPHSVKVAISSGIGLFIAFIGLQNSGLCVDSATLVGIISFPENFHTAGICALLTLIGLFFTAVFYTRKMKGAILYGILLTWILGMLCQVTGLYVPTPDAGFYSLFPSWGMTDFSKLGLTFGQCFNVDFSAVGIVNFIVVIFSFLFVDIFDTLGTLIGVATKAKMLDKDGKLPGIKPALLADSIATSAGAILGTSTTTTFVESASGVAVGGRTGLTALVTGILFLVSTLFAPIFTAIPSFATAPALIMVGFLMVGTVTEISFDLDNLTESIPAYLAIIAMPLFYSISEGISLGVISYVLLNLATGKGKKVAPLMYVLAVLFVLKYIFL